MSLTYREACALYVEWAQNKFSSDPPTPDETLSLELDGGWRLQNVNGLLAFVSASGEVLPEWHLANEHFHNG